MSGELRRVSSASPPPKLANVCDSFDIVSPIRSPASDAELLDVVDKLLSEFRSMRGSSPADYEFHINHESSEYLTYVGLSLTTTTLVLVILLGAVPARARPQVLKAFKAIGAGLSLAQSRSLLSGIPHLPKPLLDDLEQFCSAGEEILLFLFARIADRGSRARYTSQKAGIRFPRGQASSRTSPRRVGVNHQARKILRCRPSDPAATHFITERRSEFRSQISLSDG